MDFVNYPNCVTRKMGKISKNYPKYDTREMGKKYSNYPKRV